MKNICFFLGDITRSGGTERVTLQIASELKKIGYNVKILSLMEAADKPFYDIPASIHRYTILSKPVTPINRAVLRFIPVLYRLVRFIMLNKIDIIIDVDGILDIFSLPAKLFVNVKVITWEHFNFYTDLGNKFRTYIKKLSALFSDYIIVLTEEDKGYYYNNLKIKCPIDFIYNPINMKETNKDISYNLISKKIFSAGRLNTQKGFDMLIDVARIVFKKHNDWIWVIAGEGEERENLESKVKGYGLSENVIFAGNVKNIEDYYAESAMFVLTSRFEGFGLVITEAKKFRLPVVSFKCKAGPGELIMDKHNGFLVDCYDINIMAEKIIMLIENDNLRMEFSENAYDDTEKFNYSAVINKWNDVFISL